LYPIGEYSYAKSEAFIIQELIKSHEKEIVQVSEAINNKLMLCKQIGTLLYINKNLREHLAVYYEDEIDVFNVHKDFIAPTLEGLRLLPVYDIRIYSPNTSLHYGNRNVLNMEELRSLSGYDEIMERTANFIWQPAAYIHTPHSSTGMKHVITLSAGLFDYSNPNYLLGVCDVYLETTVLNKALNDLSLPEGGWGIYIDGSGHEITRIGSGIISQDTVALILVDSNRFGAMLEQDALILFRTTALNNGRIIVSYPKSVIFSELRTIKEVTQAAILLSILAVIAISLGLSGFITRRLGILTAKIQQIRDTGIPFAAPVLEGKDEVAAIDRQFNKMIGEIEHLNAQQIRTEVDKKVLEMELLQAQVNPHFLYNSLSSIKWAIGSSKRQDAAGVIDSLVRFYRLSLSKGSDFIPITNELEILREYIRIQKFSYGASYEVRWDTDPNLSNLYCLKLLLQPFVENAVLHGLNAKKHDGLLSISAKVSEGCVCFTIEDNGEGFYPSCLDATPEVARTLHLPGGFGINNVKERIRMTYGDAYSVNLYSEPSKGTRIEIVIPALTLDEHTALMNKNH